MRHSELHSAGGVVQAVLQLRGGRLGTGLHPLRITGRSAALRLVDPQGNVLAHLQPSLQGTWRHYGFASRPGTGALALTAQPRAQTTPRSRQGASLSESRVRACYATRQLLLSGTETLLRREDVRPYELLVQSQFLPGSAQSQSGESYSIMLLLIIVNVHSGIFLFRVVTRERFYIGMLLLRARAELQRICAAREYKGASKRVIAYKAYNTIYPFPFFVLSICSHGYTGSIC